MNRIKENHKTSFIGKFFSALMVMFGFSACGDTPVMYGMPTMNYRVLGTVVDEDGNPIEGIKATLKDGNEDITPTTFLRYTNAEGKFGDVNFTEGFPHNTLKVVFEDIDGEENGGEFEKDSVMFDEMTKRKLEEGKNDWYEGVYEFVANKQLKKK